MMIVTVLLQPREIEITRPKSKRNRHFCFFAFLETEPFLTMTFTLLIVVVAVDDCSGFEFATNYLAI